MLGGLEDDDDDEEMVQLGLRQALQLYNDGILDEAEWQEEVHRLMSRGPSPSASLSTVSAAMPSFMGRDTFNLSAEDEDEAVPHVTDEGARSEWEQEKVEREDRVGGAAEKAVHETFVAGKHGREEQGRGGNARTGEESSESPHHDGETTDGGRGGGGPRIDEGGNVHADGARASHTAARPRAENIPARGSTRCSNASSPHSRRGMDRGAESSAALSKAGVGGFHVKLIGVLEKQVVSLLNLLGEGLVDAEAGEEGLKRALDKHTMTVEGLAEEYRFAGSLRASAGILKGWMHFISLDVAPLVRRALGHGAVLEKGFSAMSRVMKRQKGGKFVGAVVGGVTQKLLGARGTGRHRQQAHAKWLMKNKLVSVDRTSIDATGLGLFQLLSAVDRAGPEPIRKRRSSLSHLIDQASEDDDCEPELPFVTVHGRMFAVRPSLSEIRHLLALAEKRALEGGDADDIVHLEDLITWEQALHPVLTEVERIVKRAPDMVESHLREALLHASCRRPSTRSAPSSLPSTAVPPYRPSRSSSPHSPPRAVFSRQKSGGRWTRERTISAPIRRLPSSTASSRPDSAPPAHPSERDAHNLRHSTGRASSTWERSPPWGSSPADALTRGRPLGPHRGMSPQMSSSGARSGGGSPSKVLSPVMSPKVWRIKGLASPKQMERYQRPTSPSLESYVGEAKRYAHVQHRWGRYKGVVTKRGDLRKRVTIHLQRDPVGQWRPPSAGSAVVAVGGEDLGARVLMDWDGASAFKKLIRDSVVGRGQVDWLRTERTKLGWVVGEGPHGGMPESNAAAEARLKTSQRDKRWLHGWLGKGGGVGARR